MLCQAEKSGVLRSSARGSGSGFLRHILGVLISSARSSAKGKAVGPVVVSEHQAEKHQHRGACALRGSVSSVWWESGRSGILNYILGALRSSARGSANGEAVGPAVASEAIGTPWSG